MAARQILVSSIRLSFNSKFPGNNISVWNRSMSTTCVMSKTGLQMKFQKEQTMSSNGILFQYHGSHILHMGKTGHEISKGISAGKTFTTGTSLTYKTSSMTQFKASNSSTLQNYQQNLGYPWRNEHISSNQIYWRKILSLGLAAFFILSLYRRQARLDLEKSLKEDKEQKLKKEKALILSEESECSKQTFVSDAEIPGQKIFDPCKRSPFCYLKFKESLKNEETEECVDDEICDCIVEEDEFDDDYYALL